MTATHPMIPGEIHFSHEVCQILADMNSHLQPHYLELFRRYPCADGLRDIAICQSAQPTDAETLIEQVRQGQLSWIGIGWLIFITAFANASRKKGLTPVQYADWLYDQCDAINREVGGRAAWIEAYGEIGNSVSWPQGKTFSKKEALAYFRGWLRDGRSLTEHWQQLCPPETLTYFQHAKRRDDQLRNLPIYYSEGTLYAIHEAFRNGFPLVAYEGACSSWDSFQTGIAFVRGGAKMYDALWGIDLSAWGGYMNGNVVETNQAGTWDQAMTPDHLYRIWMTSYLSGCNTLLHEVGYCFFYTGTGHDLLPSDYGYQAMRFYRLTKDCLRDRGRAVVPFAVMLEEEHGYRGSLAREFTRDGKLIEASDAGTPQSRLNLWSNRVSGLTRGDWQIHRTLAAIWPFSDNLWTCYFGRWPDEKPVNHPTRAPQLEAMIKVGEIDPREVAPYLRDSAWADGFDVIIEDTAENVLNTYYRVVLLAGDIQTDNGLWGRLKRYMENGGVVVLTAEQLDETARRDLAVTLAAQPDVLDLRGVLAAGIRFPVRQKTLVNALTHRRHDIQVWAADEDTGQPLVLEVAGGAGRIYIVLAAHGMDQDAKELSGVTRAVLNHLHAQYVGIHREGPPCQMLVNARQDDTLVTLLNHTGQDWHGDVVFTRGTYPAVAEVRDLIQDQAYPETLIAADAAVVRVTVRVPAFEVKVLSFGPKRDRQPFAGVTTATQGHSADDQAYLKEIVRKGPRSVIGTSP